MDFNKRRANLIVEMGTMAAASQSQQKRQLVFLTYLARSGSTYLANQLSQFENIGVGIEARIPDDICYGEIFFKDSKDIDAFLDVLYSDSKFQLWNLPRNDLKQRLKSAPLPLHYRNLIEILFDEYFQSQKRSTYICKSSEYIWHIPELRKEIPDAKIIFVMRDPRAIFRSQESSFHSETGKPMETHVYRFSYYAKQALHIANHYKNEPWFHIVRYENLVTHQAQELNQVLRFLEEPAEARTQDTNYLQHIPKTQRHLHVNVGKPPQPDRVDAWKQSLSQSKLLLIEIATSKILRTFQYDLLCSTRPHKYLDVRLLYYFALYFIYALYWQTLRPIGIRILRPWHARYGGAKVIAKHKLNSLKKKVG